MPKKTVKDRVKETSEVEVEVNIGTSEVSTTQKKSGKGRPPKAPNAAQASWLDTNRTKTIGELMQDTGLTQSAIEKYFAQEVPVQNTKPPKNKRVSRLSIGEGSVAMNASVSADDDEDLSRIRANRVAAVANEQAGIALVYPEN